jgi:peptide/nickel transport system substrate-binding protein
VLEKAAFPLADPDKPDLYREMNTGIAFSGGPWKMISWNRERLVLARNDRYWGHLPLLDQVTFVHLEDRAILEFSLASGQVDAGLFRGELATSLSQDVPIPHLKTVSGSANDEEALWFNLDYPPMNDFAVRQAIAYGVDRQAIIDQIIKKNDPAAVLNCLPPLSPVIDDWCTSTVTAPVEKYTYQPDISLSLLEGDGYDCSGVPAKPCTKDRHALRITAYYMRGDVRRQAVGEILREGMKKAGIDWRQVGTDQLSNGVLVGDYQVVEHDFRATVDPSPIAFGYNIDYFQGLPEDHWEALLLHYRNPELEPIIKQVDLEIDPSTRHELITQIYSHINSDLVALPLFSGVVITAWRADRIAGPIGEWNEAPYGAFWNIDYWYAL